MIGRLFHAPLENGKHGQAIGVATVGSSEAIMLAGLAFKKKWQNQRKAEGKPYDRPNIVTGANVQVHNHPNFDSSESRGSNIQSYPYNNKSCFRLTLHMNSYP